MPNAFVQQKAEQSTSSVSSFTTSAFTVGVGNALAVCLSVWTSNPVTALTTDSHSDVFVTESVKEAVTGTPLVQWDLATNVAGGSTTVTVTPSASGFISVCAQEYSGVAVAPVEASGTAQDPESGNQLVMPPALVPPSAGDLYLSAWTHNGSANESFTANTGWTLRSNLTLTANIPLGSEEFIGSGSQVGSATLGGSGAPNWRCATMALRAADVAAPDDGASPNFVINDFPMTNRGFRGEG